jgi:hypothetical protein
MIDNALAAPRWRESSEEAACEKRKEYYADNYMELMRTEWNNARVH